MSLWLYPYRQQSQSARDLASKLNVKIIKREDSRFRPSPRKTVINWGASQFPEPIFNICTVLNHPQFVERCASKRLFFHTMSISELKPRIVPWTTDATVAHQWIRDGKQVVCRADSSEIKSNHGGGDIAIIGRDSLQAEIEEAFEKARLFTMYVKKRSEWRVHCARRIATLRDGIRVASHDVQILDVQQKKRRQTWPDGRPVLPDEIDSQVRSWINGWVFARREIECPPDVLEQAELAFKASELDFGAVDVIWNEHREEAYVLEINTAPGIEGSTIDMYAEHFANWR